MKKIAAFLETTTLGGLLVLVPLLLVVRAVMHAVNLAVDASTPIARVFTEDPRFPVLVAALLLVAVSFLLGLLAITALAKAAGGWIEHKLLVKLPGYRVLKNLTRSMVQADEVGGFKPALFVSKDGQKELAYLIEEHGDGLVTVMLPLAPTPFAGTVRIVRREQVEVLPARLSDLTRVLGDWGAGMGELLRKSGPPRG